MVIGRDGVGVDLLNHSRRIAEPSGDDLVRYEGISSGIVNGVHETGIDWVCYFKRPR